MLPGLWKYEMEEQINSKRKSGPKKTIQSNTMVVMSERNEAQPVGCAFSFTIM
jgi:hypothetical protein